MKRSFIQPLVQVFEDAVAGARSSRRDVELENGPDGRHPPSATKAVPEGPA
jgi:hypothetical protein